MYKEIITYSNLCCGSRSVMCGHCLCVLCRCLFRWAEDLLHTQNSLELHHPSLAPAQRSSCMIHSSPVEPPPLPSPFPTALLCLPSVYPLSAHFICSSKHFTSSRAPLPPNPSSPRLRSYANEKLSHNFLFLYSEPPASQACAGPSGPIVTISM